MLKDKIKKWMKIPMYIYKGWKISTKLFMLFSVMAVSIFIALQWQNYLISRDAVEERAAESARMATFQANQYLDSYYDNIKTILLMISSQKNLLESPDVNETLKRDAQYSAQLVKTLYVATADGHVYCSNELVYGILGNDQIQRIAEIARRGYSGITLEGPYYTPISSHTVAFFIPIFQGGSYRGTVIAEASIDSLYQNLMLWLPGPGRSFVLTNSDGADVCYDQSGSVLPYQAATVPAQIQPAFRELLRKNPTGTGSIQYDGRRYLVTHTTDNRLNWNLYLIVDSAKANPESQKVFANFLLSVGLGVLFILALTFAISYFFTNPIRRFALKMNSFTQLDQLPIVAVDRNDEVGQLEKNYNSMLLRIQQLIEKQKQTEKLKSRYEFKMLQSKITPHFLYNTLACINSLARQHREAEISGTIRALVGLLSFSFDRQAEFIPLREELKGLQMYVDIQRIRYGPIFEVETDVPPEVLDFQIPKLTLQPILENALFHGVVPKQKDGRIRVRIRKRNSLLIVAVTDNGVGFSGDAQAVLSGTDRDPEEDRRFNHVGLSNIHNRIRLYYGEQYGLRIRGKAGVGTVVKLVFPTVPDKKNNPLFSSSKRP